MPVPPSNPQDTQLAIAVLFAIAAYLCIAHLRTTLRVILAVVIALAIVGAVVGIEDVASLIASHHR
jgi:hypothetical protein